MAKTRARPAKTAADGKSVRTAARAVHPHAGAAAVEKQLLDPTPAPIEISASAAPNGPHPAAARKQRASRKPAAVAANAAPLLEPAVEAVPAAPAPAAQPATAKKRAPRKKKGAAGEAAVLLPGEQQALQDLQAMSPKQLHALKDAVAATAPAASSDGEGATASTTTTAMVVTAINQALATCVTPGNSDAPAERCAPAHDASKQRKRKRAPAVGAAEAPPSSSEPAPVTKPQAKRRGKAKADAPEDAAAPLASAARSRRPGKAAAAAVAAAASEGGGEAIAAEAAAQAAALQGKRVRAAKAKGKVAADEEAGPTVDEAAADAPAKARKSRRKAAAKAVDYAEDEVVNANAEEAAAAPRKKPVQWHKRWQELGLPIAEIPTRDVLSVAPTVAARPVPNLGYACLNMTLAVQKPAIFTNRGCILRTFTEKGLPHISALALQNCLALAGIVQWNHEHGIRLFRMSSNFFPWCTEYKMEDLPDYPAIADALAFAGELARAYGQRLTFHPSHFIKLAAPNPELVDKSIAELEVHSKIVDLLGFPPSPENKINIHVGGVYGDKDAALERFAAAFQRLSPNLQKRLTVENDDVASSYSITDLLPLHEATGIPLVFDFHHHKFCPGGLTEREAFLTALSTWPEGIRPVCHWSESQPGRKPHAHSDFVAGPMGLHGLEGEVDVMIEAKCKELALLRFRNMSQGLPTDDIDRLHEIAARVVATDE